jgi:SRSO17 transposase
VASGKGAVWVEQKKHMLIAAINEATGEIKYFLTNAANAALTRILNVAFRRWTVEHAFRLAKQEAGLMHYEGRDYFGLIHHLLLALIVLGFVTTHTERLRGEKSGDNSRASVPGVEPAMLGGAPEAAGQPRTPTHIRSHLLPPTEERTGHQVPQEAAA